MAAMTKEAYQSLGALRFAVAKQPCSTAEPRQQVTLHLDNIHITRVRSVPQRTHLI